MIEKFNIEYCKQFSPEKLRSIYRNESKEVLDALIEKVHGTPKKVKK